jgi:hypothetical protein
MAKKSGKPNDDFPSKRFSSISHFNNLGIILFKFLILYRYRAGTDSVQGELYSLRSLLRPECTSGKRNSRRALSAFDSTEYHNGFDGRDRWTLQGPQEAVHASECDALALASALRELNSLRLDNK